MNLLKSACLMSVALMAFSTATNYQVSGNWSKLERFSDENECSKYTWLFWNNGSGQCVCGPTFHGRIQCNLGQKEVWMTEFMCMTYDSISRKLTAGDCPFAIFDKSRLEYRSARLPKLRDELNNAVCGTAHREGLMCSKCKPGYGPSVLSYGYPCAKCSDTFYGWLLYLSVAFLPTAVFFLIIVLCQIHLTFPPLAFLVFAFQLISVSLSWSSSGHSYPDKSLADILAGIALTVVTSFNLDFFHSIIPPFCVTENLSNLQMLCMDYIAAFSPLFITVVMYICIQQHAKGCRVIVFLWKPFAYCFKPLVRKFNWNPLASTAHVFSSFLLLSSTKILFTSFSLLKQAYVNTISNEAISMSNKLSLYYDPNLTLFDQHHLPYALIAILVCTIFVILPCLVLCLYPTRWFQKCLNWCGFKWHALHAFADVFNGCYKDGTDGTCDCRYFAGFYFLLRLFFIGNVIYPHLFIIEQTLSIVSVVIFALASPYKNRIYNVLDTCGLVLGVCRLCFHHHKDIFNAPFSVFVVTFFIGFVCCKVALKLNCQGSRKLKALADKVFGNSVSSPAGRGANGAVDSHPDRVASPQGYRLLSEIPEEQCDLESNVRNVSPYGSI